MFVQVIGTNYSICPNFENDVCVADWWKDMFREEKKDGETLDFWTVLEEAK